MHKRLIAIALIAAAMPAAALATENGPIREIRLSSGGMAEISRTAAVGPDGTVRLDVPLDQVDDILKSLVLDGTPAHSLSLPGPQPLEERLEGLPFSAEALSSVPSLLASMPGAAVTVSSNATIISGKVLGIERRTDDEGRVRFLLSVLTGQASVETLELAGDASVVLRDTMLRDRLAEAVEAIGLARSDRTRTLRIDARGAAGRDVRLSYVVAAPIWKTAYRIVLGEDGKARLQAWTILENASGEDWHDVSLILTSSAPVTLTQRLHQHYWRTRHEVPVDTAPQPVPEADTGNIGGRTSLAAARESAAVAQSRPMQAPAPAPQRATEAAAASDAIGGGITAATATESDISATFELPGSHDLANGDTLSVPIIDAEIDAGMVSLYRAGSPSPHPVAAVMLRNETDVSLPPGILTIYDGASGYAGDARLDGLPSGDTRLASFAVDRKVAVTEDRTPREEVAEIKVVGGMLHATQKHRITTTYTVSGALDGDRTVVIEHPVMQGWTFSSPQSDGRTTSHFRLKIKVPKGTEGTLTAVQEQLRQRRYALADTEPALLAGWSASAADPKLARKLDQLAAARAEQAAAQRELRRFDDDLARLDGEQARIRQNLNSVPDGSDLGKRYLTQLETSENAITELSGKRQAARDALEQLEARTLRMLKTF